MEEGVNEIGISHIILDNLQFILGNNVKLFEDRFMHQDRFVHRLRSFATKSGCHLTLIAHPRKEGDGEQRLTLNSLYGGAKIAQEADNILLIQQESDSAFPKKYIQFFASLNLY
ncbi:unnamed protein product [Protopolystoma xenopodis]|uniref:SF4 helicase domain-containing protein n=1 Tax=Protopolystoma xenopodis TaxID=117903 RepID=A0A3S5CHL6_9PLAT|nr:unnamed protein product [Protopolystoma xenopodis]